MAHGILFREVQILTDYISPITNLANAILQIIDFGEGTRIIF
jgi:hypothetical protein